MLRLMLRPSERVFIGGAVIRNGSQKTVLYVENEVPLLRAVDILPLDEVRGIASQLYLMVQAMYMDGQDAAQYLARYRELRDLAGEAIPQWRDMLRQIDDKVTAGDLYRALKSCRNLVEAERIALREGDTSQDDVDQ